MNEIELERYRREQRNPMIYSSLLSQLAHQSVCWWIRHGASDIPVIYYYQRVDMGCHLVQPHWQPVR